MDYTYRSLTQAMETGGVEDPATEAALLLEHVFGVSYATLMTEPHRTYTSPSLDTALARRLEHEPLQYILGKWDFFGCRFTVNEHCLIPRPDTEILVETALKVLPRGAKIADLCTGSGCIAVALLHSRPDMTAHALELYPETLKLAVRNAEDNGVAARFSPVEADLLRDGMEKLTPHAPYDAILSNPPYIPTAVIQGLSPEVHREPRAALDGGEDGLTFYRAILKNYAGLVRPGGQILLEIGYDQADALRALAHTYLPTASVRVLQDLGGNDRVVRITLPVT
jgi:release factor glutamine methyltransferase